MKTIILEKPGSFTQADTAPPSDCPSGFARVAIRKVGICGTDMHAFRGRQPFFTYPRVLGHELGVEVLQVDDNAEGIQPGDRCAVEPYVYCGECVACRRGKTNCCTTLEVIGVHTDGGMREEMIVPVKNLHSSNKLTLEQLALVEMMCIGAHAVGRAAPEPQEACLVIGAGPIGLSIIESLKLAQARILVLELSPRRRSFCREHFAVEQCVDAADDPGSKIRDLLAGELPTVVFDATGNPQSMMQSLQYLAHGGKLVLVGLYVGDLTFQDHELHARETTLLRTRNATATDFKNVIRHLEEDRIDVQPWITHHASYDSFIDQFPTWLDPESGTVKAILEFP